MLFLLVASFEIKTIFQMRLSIIFFFTIAVTQLIEFFSRENACFLQFRFQTIRNSVEMFSPHFFFAFWIIEFSFFFHRLFIGGRGRGFHISNMFNFFTFVYKFHILIWIIIFWLLFNWVERPIWKRRSVKPLGFSFIFATLRRCSHWIGWA